MSKAEVEKNLKDAICDALDSGWYFDDICNVVAKSLNTYRNERKEQDDNGQVKENRRNQKSY